MIPKFYCFNFLSCVFIFTYSYTKPKQKSERNLKQPSPKLIKQGRSNKTHLIRIPNLKTMKFIPSFSLNMDQMSVPKFSNLFAKFVSTFLFIFPIA